MQMQRIILVLKFLQQCISLHSKWFCHRLKSVILQDTHAAL